MVHQTQIRYLLKYILVFTLLSHFFVSDLFSSKITKPKLDIEMTLDTPDSIIIGEPFKVRFSFIVNDSVVHKSDIPDRAKINLPRDCEILSGSTTWRGMLHKGSEVTMEVVAVLQEIKMKAGIKGSISTDFRKHPLKSDDHAYGKTRNMIVKENIKVLGGEEYVRFVLDTLTFNGKKISEKNKNILNLTKTIPLGRRFVLSKTVYNDSSNCFYLRKLWINPEKPLYFYIYANEESDEFVEIESWKSDNKNLIIKRQDDGRYSAILSNWVEESSTFTIIELEIIADSIKYYLLLKVVKNF